jgi:hypothetical protein
MAITLRATKGSRLTTAEMDANFTTEASTSARGMMPANDKTKLNDAVSAREFGFSGTGVAATDTTAWNAMVAAINANSAKRVYIPSGFVIALDNPNTIFTASEWSIFSDGMNTARIEVVSGPSTIFRIGDGATRAEHVNIYNLGLEYVGTPAIGSWQFEVMYSVRVNIANIYSKNASLILVGGATQQVNSLGMVNVTAVVNKAVAQPGMLIESTSGSMIENVRLGATAAAAHDDFRFIKIAPPTGSNVDTITFRDVVCNEATEDHKVALEIDYSYADVGTITFARCAFEQSKNNAVHIHNNNAVGVGGFADRIKFIDGTRLTPHSTILNSHGLLVEKIGDATCSVYVNDCTIGKGRGSAVLVNGPLTDDQSLLVVIDGNVIYDRRQGLGNPKPGIEVNASGMVITSNIYIANRGNGLFTDYITDSTFTEGVSVLGNVERLTVERNDFRACTSAEVIDVSLITSFGSGGKYSIHSNIGNTAIVAYPETAAIHRTALGLGSTAILDTATTAQIRNNTASKVLTTDVVYMALGEVTLTDAATIAVDMSAFINAIVTLGGNRTLGQPTNTKIGQTGRIRIRQDATGSRTLAYHTNWKFENGTVPTLTTAANATDILFFEVMDSSFIFASLSKGVA